MHVQSKPAFTILIYALITRQLKYAREGVSHGGLGLLTKHRKRERLRTLLDLLKTLKTLVGEIVFLSIVPVC